MLELEFFIDIILPAAS